MLFKQSTLDGIAAGTVDLAFRRWERPRVRAGRVRTAIGVVAIEQVDAVQVERVSDRDARRAGHDSRAALLAELARHHKGTLYRIALRFAGADPRVALRERSRWTATERDGVLAKLARMDAASPSGPWTFAALRAIEAQPEQRAGDLAAQLGMERLRFKARVRRLKELGLTESLEIGYRLSPRGRALLSPSARAGAPRPGTGSTPTPDRPRRRGAGSPRSRSRASRP